VAASTHDGEEDIVAETHRRLRERFPDLLTIIVPRHPERGEAVTASIAGEGMNVARRSRGQPIARDTDI
jgi:3-deoxy-D-manno-octulosonic-acid transferase